jgi:Nif-specific regulatory protein
MLLDCLAVLEKTLGMRRATIMLLSPDGEELTLEAVRSDVSPENLGIKYQRGEGVVGGVLESGHPAVIARISEEPEFQNRIHRRGKSERTEMSFVCVPVTIEKEVVGTLSADLAWSPEHSLEDTERILSIVAGMIANDVKSRHMMQVERRNFEAENMRLRNRLEEKFRPENIIGNSRRMEEVYQKIHQVAGAETTVLIRGESGTGKELVTNSIHYNSPRARKPLVKVNCAALSENLLESELFGHEKGAFTGALQRRAGRIEEAEGGTLFLDEIGEFSQATQIKLLRVIQEREFQRVGGNSTMKADVRIITATNKNLEEAVESGTFRQDLYYRINVFPIILPPLRERREDVMLLADFFAEEYGARMGKDIQRISTPVINMLTAYHWPGNVRELENCIEHAVLLCADGVIRSHDLPPSLQMPEQRGDTSPGTLKARVSLLEREAIVDALKRGGGSVTAAAGELGITPRMVRYKIKNLGIDYTRLFKKAE